MNSLGGYSGMRGRTNTGFGMGSPTNAGLTAGLGSNTGLSMNGQNPSRGSFYSQNMGQGLRGGSPGENIPKGYRKGVLNNFTPEQNQLFQELFSHVSPDSYLSKLAMGDESQFEEMEAPQHRQFQGLLGNIASKFSGMGTGARRSSGFQNTVNSAASNFAQDLASKRQDLQKQAIMELMGLSGSLLSQRPQENLLTNKSNRQSFGQSLLSSSVPALASGLGQAAGKFLGG